jgi:hypothetical protein
MFHKDTQGNIVAEVIDNYLPNEIADELEEHFLSRNPQWRYQSKVAVEQMKNRSTGSPSDCFWAFVIWRQPEGILAPEFEQLVPIIEKLNYKALIRIKANMYSSTENIQEHAPHQDFTFNNKSALYYVNSNNGYTMLHGNIKVESVKNRLVVFDGSIEHYSTNCTDEQVRVSINFNFL